MMRVRLLADDLTGALDTAAEFVGLCGPFDVIWAEAGATPGLRSLAIDSGTRERSKAESVGIVGRLAPLLRDATIAYKKVDSLLRGGVDSRTRRLPEHWPLGVVRGRARLRLSGTPHRRGPAICAHAGGRLASRRRQSAGPTETGGHRRHSGVAPTRCRKAAFRYSMPRATSISIASSRWAADARASALVRQRRAWPARWLAATAPPRRRS